MFPRAARLSGARADSRSALGLPGGMSRRRMLTLTGTAGAAAAAAGALGAAPASAAERTWRVTGEDVAPLAHFDGVMKDYMQARGITAGSLAVARNGRLSLARGYTWGDDSVATTGVTDVFRIASLSKPVAGTAAMRLAQEGELDLDAPLADLVDLSPLAGETADPRLGEVTVRRALQHLGGWDRDVSFDPLWNTIAISREMGVDLPLGRSEVIAYTSGMELDHAPGTRYAYSNYGYLLVSEAITAVTGMSYEDHVVSDVLGAVDIARMRAGRSLSADQEGEVGYDSKYTVTSALDSSGAQVPYPYGGFNLEIQLGNGGWVASAADLARFCTIYDTPEAAGVLTPDSISTVFEQPETGGGATHYGLGWSVRPTGSGENTWHTGSMPGTYTFLARSNGYTVVALFNRRDEGDALNWGEIDPKLWDAVNEVGTWPTEDLTPIYF
ncbi:serine hydrolase domain-containing protein [Nocardiopsis dassonvillei]|uniref:serine hydrolase domain-containing protein n=1 Tax=Nocardiopsis dassonvillei TaxID=2014 RepID=UPI0036F873C8